MEQFILYLLKSSICLSVFFIFYKLFLKHNTSFKKVRLYLLLSILLALVIPLTKISVPFSIKAKAITEKITYIAHGEVAELPETATIKGIEYTLPLKKVDAKENFDWKSTAQFIYLIVASILLFRLLLVMFNVLRSYHKSEISRYASYKVVSNLKINNSYSFFKWIFINKQELSESDYNKILAHEIIHVTQYHSVDVIIVELLAAAMWFNPVIWLYKKDIQLLHEYLADEGALGTGLDKLQYQALLVNQIAEEKLICLSSGFNHSLIKKRIVMMTKSKFNQRTKLKIFALVPISAVLLLGMSLTNEHKHLNYEQAEYFLCNINFNPSFNKFL